jgi:subtilase family serine protease
VSERPNPRQCEEQVRARFGWAGLAVGTLVGTAMLAAGCGNTTATRSSAAQSVSKVGAFGRAVAFAQCMRTHGEPNFPDPVREGGGVQEKISHGSGIVPSSPQFTAATNACKQLLTSGGTGTRTSPAAAGAGPAGGGAVGADCLTLTTSPCYALQQLRVAYGIQPLLDRGITGRGQTIVLPEFPPAPGAGVRVPTVTDIRQDLAKFDRRFRLPVARLQVVNTLAHAASPWLASDEEVGDTEIVHAVAPDAAIREVLIPSPYTTNLGRITRAVVAALRLGLARGAVISLSAGTGEQCFTPAEVAKVSSILQAARRDRVTVVVSTGDSGAATTACPPNTGSATVKGVDLPASDPLVLAVGGTTLRAGRKTGAYSGETTWNLPPAAGGPGAGGGGFSRLFPRPAYQNGIARIGAARGVPDVAADADPRTGMAVTFTDGRKHTMLAGAGGVSAAAPLWAAVIALANQYAGRRLGFVNPALYRIGHGASYHQAFHDVTSGTNTVELPGPTITGFQAAPGWDPVTGWGSPNAQALVPMLARHVSR